GRCASAGGEGAQGRQARGHGRGGSGRTRAYAGEEVPSETDPNTYTTLAIQEMLGPSRGVITGLIASGFVAPSRGPRNEYRFTFREVGLLRTAVELQAGSIPRDT